MENVERWVRREARAMTRREVITKAIAKQLSWGQAGEIIGVKPRQMRRIRRRMEHYGLEAVMDQRGGRPRRKRIKAGTIELLCRLKRDVYPDFSLRHFYEQVTEKHSVKVSYNWLRLMLQEAGVVEKEPARGKYRRQRERRPMVGMLVHLDASTHEWIAGLPRQDLVVALDDADGRILYARFFPRRAPPQTSPPWNRWCATTVDSANSTPTVAATSAKVDPPAKWQRSSTARSARRCARWASVRSWPVHLKPAAAASAPSAPSRPPTAGTSG
jgi:transposase